MDLVSVIIPCYNVSPFVDKFSWIFEQTYPELEVVLVDDCSTDDTWQKLREFKQQYADKRIVLEHHEHNHGAAETRNHGLAVSSGKYVCFWDADDRAYPQFVEKMLAKLQQEQADFVCCGYNTIDCKDVLETHHVSGELLSVQDINELRLLVFAFENVPWLKFVCREFIQENAISFPKIFRGEDRCWTTQLVLNASKIAFVDEPLYQYYRDNPVSLTHVLDARTMQSFWDMSLLELEYIRKLKFDAVLYERWLSFFFDTFLYLNNKMAVDLQKQFALEMRDFCQNHEINLKGESLPFSYTIPLYRLFPNIGSFVKKRKKLKRGHKLYSQMRQTFALINIVGLVIREDAKKAKKTEQK